MKNILSRLFPHSITLCLTLATAAVVRGDDVPEPLRFFRPLHLDAKLRVDAQRDISLRLDPSIEPIGQQLSTHQIWKLDQIREELPQQFQIIAHMFPRQIAEYLQRQGVTMPTRVRLRTAPANDAATEVAMRIAERYLSEPLPAGISEEQMRVRREFVSAAAGKLTAENAALRQVLENCARHTDPDFGTAKKAAVFAALKKQYSPFKEVSMSVVGNTLILGGRVVTETLRADAASVGRTPEQFAAERRAELSQVLEQWRAAQISGAAYAGTIKSFLRDPRLADFTPDEVHRAYARIFGRDLKTDIAADRLSEKEGRPVTYAELMASTK